MQSKLPKAIRNYSVGVASHSVQSDLGLFHICLNLPFSLGIQHGLYHREPLCYGALAGNEQHPQGGLPSPPTQLAKSPHPSCHSRAVSLR